MKLLWALAALLLCCWRADASTGPQVSAEPSEVSNQTSAVLTCNITDSSLPIKGSYWTHNDKVLDNSKSSSKYASYNLEKITYQQSGHYECVFETETGSKLKRAIEVKTLPHVAAYKRSEHGNENDKSVLTCVAHGYPLPTDWMWYKEEGGEQKPIVNATERYEIKSTPNKTMLTIEDLNIETDGGSYLCYGANELGQNKDAIFLRVRSRLAALWPFLGIVAEVIILVTVIFIYEKRRKPDDITDDDDSGAAPLKSNSTTNHKDKNVRQRNAN